MPLDLGALQGGLESTFADPPPDAGGCAQGWASAVEAWAAGIIPPSTAVNAAAEGLAGALTTAFQTESAIPGMESAFVAFATSVAGGMAPTYAGTPPPAPVGFAGQFGGPFPETHAEAAAAVASLIHAWAQTGLATLVAPPNTVVPWS